MRTLVFLFTRVPGASVLTMMGLAKLARYPASAKATWYPFSTGRRFWDAFLWVAFVGEMALGLIVLLAPGWVVLSLVVPSISALTLYGLAATKNSGTCGCSGSAEQSTYRMVVTRNGCLLAAVGLGAIFAPPVQSVVRISSLTMSFVPAAIVVLAAATAALRRRPGSGNRVGASSVGGRDLVSSKS